MAAAAVVVVLGVVGGVFAALHHSTAAPAPEAAGHGTTRWPRPSQLPGARPRPRRRSRSPGVRTGTTALGGNPFGVAVTADGKFSFVSLGNAVAVLNNNDGSLAPTQVATIPASGAKKTEAITGDGQYLLAVGEQRVIVITWPGGGARRRRRRGDRRHRRAARQ